MSSAMRNRLALLAVVGALAAPAAALEVNEAVNKVQARYDATHDFTADVTQESTIASLGKTVTAHGTIAFKKPGKMRWDLTDNDPQLIVADGKTLWLYRPADRQVLKAPFDAAFRSSAPISFLTGVGKIAQDFDATLDGESPDHQTFYLLLVPRQAGSGVGRLRLTVTRDSFDIRGAEVHDPLGNVSRLRFDNVKRNVGVSEDQFVFTVPTGVDVINAPIGQ